MNMTKMEVEFATWVGTDPEFDYDNPLHGDVLVTPHGVAVTVEVPGQPWKIVVQIERQVGNWGVMVSTDTKDHHVRVFDNGSTELE